MRSNYIDGTWTPSAGDAGIDVVNPATATVIDRVPAGHPADVDAAVRAARAAFGGWSATSAAERAQRLDAARQLLDERADSVAAMISADMGSPIVFARKVQVGTPLAVLASYVDLLAGYDFGGERMGNALVVREPAGVVGAITPWNYPLHQIVAKVAAALAAGCTVVLKPSEVAPLAAYELADIFHETGLPAGVFNLVSGSGAVTGEAITAHPDVDVVSFTGSARAGRRVAEVAAATVKRVTLELGGKSANVILPDADLATAVKVGVARAFINSGQTCNALTRMLVHSESYDDAVGQAAKNAERYTVGDPLAEGVRLGPLASQAQRERVLGYIQLGLAEGARAVAGGAEPPPGLEAGSYVRPTVFADVRPEMVIAQEEIFGPVLCVMAYSTEDEAVAIANGPAYGLAAAVWSADQEHAVQIARQLRAGQVEINGGAFNVAAPFGGFGQSGYGRELGVHGLEEFLELKALMF
ncbi:MAG TPA: aldehyde dehydrogenase family protein [Streptosporangiaceae bacterium]|nr:aldehyde dehydrogenase family protein [Streptosporangiaceae bacterium]